MMGMPTLEYCIAGFLNLKYGLIGPDSNDGLGPTLPMVLSFLTAIFFFCSVIFAPVIIGVVYNLFFNRLEDEDFSSKFGSVTDGLDLEKRSSLVACYISPIRRIILFVVSLWMYTVP